MTFELGIPDSVLDDEPDSNTLSGKPAIASSFARWENRWVSSGNLGSVEILNPIDTPDWSYFLTHSQIHIFIV